MTARKLLWGVILIPFVAAALWLLWLYRDIEVDLGVYEPEALRIAITDPSYGALACEHTGGPAPRDYGPLAAFLEEKLRRPVRLLYGRNLHEILQSTEDGIDLAIGKASGIAIDAAELEQSMRPIARLTDSEGGTDICGVFVVRSDDPARNIGELADHTVVFGPPREQERHSLALATLAANGVAIIPPLRVVLTCKEAVQQVVQEKADAAVIPDWALPLLEEHGAVGQEELRVVGRTAAVPFVTVFATVRVSPSTESAIVDALFSTGIDPVLLDSLASKTGFVGLDEKPAPPPVAEVASVEPAPTAGWTDWRGPGRDGISEDMPTRLPAQARFLWKRGLTGAGLSAVTATAAHVVVADKSEAGDQDIWRCLEADTGRELWAIAYGTPKEMEFTNAQRAAPVIHEGYVYLFGAFGDLHCVTLHGSRIAWRRNILEDFGVELPPWGTCSTPLIVDDLLIVNPGAEDASLVALGLYTGEIVWKTPGEPAGYGSMILGTFGGVRQIVGHDGVSLGGWDPNTGERLWTLLPENEGDFNVPTPIDVAGRLLVATENNGTRLYDFDPNGGIQPVPVAQSFDLAPDTSTPVVIDGLVYGCFQGLFCLDLSADLRTLYSARDDRSFRDYTALLAGNGRVLAVTVAGELVLLEAAREGFAPIARLQVFQNTEVWSHPALVANRLYIRSMKEIGCLLLDQ